jgi:3-hydroxyisobutyrate dehydrogenase-like beta-hydroxyacid dehydrogenase
MKLAIVGLGKMGEPIARRLLAAGHELVVYNRTPGRADHLVELGATEALAPREVWSTAEACITMVADDKALEAVTLGDAGLLGDEGRTRTLIDMSTVSPAASAEVARAAERAEIAYLRAPVSGNPTVVEAGNLGIMVSGGQEVFERLEQVLRDIGPNVFYVGLGEEARVLKLALNLMIAGTAELMAEALVLGEASGLDRARMLEVMAASAIGSPFVKYKTAPLVEDDYSPTFTSAAMHKDLGLALDAGEVAGVPLPVTAVVQQLVRACVSSGMADLDLMVLVPRLQRESGFEPAAAAER